MTKIDEVVERVCTGSITIVGEKYPAAMLTDKELRALLQEVHDAAVAECGKDADRLDWLTGKCRCEWSGAQRYEIDAAIAAAKGGGDEL